MRIDQLLSGYADGDAISRDARAIRKALRDLGYESDIYSDTLSTTDHLLSDSRDAASYDGRAGDVLINHYALGSSVDSVWRESAATVVLRYHNITPASFFRGYDDALAERLENGRKALRDAAAASACCWPVSSYNGRELEELGVTNPSRVLPLLFDQESLRQTPEQAILDQYDDDQTTLLYIGRIVPNKKLEDLIAMFAWYHHTLNGHSRLLVVGSPDSCPRYFAFCRMLATEFGLPRVNFEGFRSDQALAAYYQCADAFITTSVHEGYCLPLIEAMLHDAVVIAHERGGMPEAMGGAGVMYDDLDHAGLAALVQHALSDNVRPGILEGQRKRVAEIDARDVGRELRELIETLPTSSG